jgi:hypothetical protein
MQAVIGAAGVCGVTSRARGAHGHAQTRGDAKKSGKTPSVMPEFSVNLSPNGINNLIA